MGRSNLPRGIRADAVPGCECRLVDNSFLPHEIRWISGWLVAAFGSFRIILGRCRTDELSACGGLSDPAICVPVGTRVLRSALIPRFSIGPARYPQVSSRAPRVWRCL